MALLEDSKEVGGEVNQGITDKHAASVYNPASVNLPIRVKSLEK